MDLTITTRTNHNRLDNLVGVTALVPFFRLISSIMTSVWSLVGTGIGLGVVHVLTGPDHLSALATLSANVDTRTAFFLGVRWGIGHSTGLLLVGTVLIVLTRSSDAETIEVPSGLSRFFESLVGVFMVMLGVYGIRKAVQRKPYVPASLDLGTAETISSSSAQSSVAIDSGGCDEISIDIHDEPSNFSSGEMSVSEENDENDRESSESLPFISSLSTRTVALFAGIVHGLAGPGGVLGVIPAVQLHDARLAIVYLGCFCASSTVTMGIFAVLYASCSKAVSQETYHGFKVEIASAALSLLVGILWLVLLSCGKLEEVFP